MEKRYTDIDENAPVHILPYEVMRDLSRILDGGDAWVELAGYMPDITIQDVDGCRQYSTYHRGSPSEYLLRIWASKGYSILSLYNLFAIARMVRCMRIMRHLVSECHHHLEDYALSAEESNVPSSSYNNHQYSRGQHASITSTKRGDVQQNMMPVSASTSTNKSSGVSTTGDSISPGNVSDPVWTALQNTLTVPYSELQSATSNFSDENILGKGGYGVVYVGEWKHTKIAIQRERLRQSLQELRTLAKFRHDNILPLYAFSLDGPEPCLVYQFMSNGSLEDRLLCRRGTAPLSWPQKKEIADGTARGLHFLHSIGSVPIIHGDVKSANILLDRHLEPKLGDFGLSRDGKVEADADEKSPLIASHVKGTLAYLPPEFITNRILSTKLDVYSFGIVLLEICTGMRAFMDSRVPPNLLDYCVANRDSRKGASNRTEWIESLMDKRTPSVEEQEVVVAWCSGTIQLGLLCSSKDRHQRPSFPDIVHSLSQLYLSFD
ncbi:hypothetical protein Q1695_006790 [Nippostrongylus brasiliensis]|nr:hypothetical protein Q1695_006790 [Nippostrongylus brasiliensis]